MLDIIYYSRMVRVDSSGTKRFVVRSEFGDVPGFSIVLAETKILTDFMRRTII